MNDNENTIWTDSYKTKDMLWDNFSGFVSAYNDHVMYASKGRRDMITDMTLHKYMHGFYDLIKIFFAKFAKELGEDKIQNMKILLKKQRLTLEEYQVIRNFYGEFMFLSGIMNVTMEKEDPGEALSHGFY